MSIFKPRKIKDPRTSEQRIVSPEEQELMLQKGVIFDLPSEEKNVFQKKDDKEKHSPNTP